MNILALECATKKFSLAIAKNGKILRSKSLVLDKLLDSSIIPTVDASLKAAKMKLKDIDAFAVGLGPGSFTSLRVGLSTVKGFAMAMGKPIVGISSLDLIAMNVIAEPCDEICVLMDARRGKVYACIYKTDSNVETQNFASLRQVTGYQLTTVENILDQVRGKTLFVGDAVGSAKEKIQAAYKKARQTRKTACQALFADEKYWYPQAKHLARIGTERAVQCRFDDSKTLVPIYLYQQDCQVQPT